MKILVLGRGKTGALVAEIAKERGQEVRSMGRADNPEGRGLTPELCRETEVVIDFTTPHAVIPNIIRCLEAGIPMVVGTTGWHQHLAKVQELVAERRVGFLYGSNFSVGMIFFFKAFRAVARMLTIGCRTRILETHHVNERDKP